MTKPVIVTRAGKGAPLTRAELDANFQNIDDAVITVTGDTGSITNSLNGSFQISGGVATTSKVVDSALIIDLDNTAVTPGSYTTANITVDQQGRITSASNGSVSVTPAGSNQQLQYNNNGSLGASSSLTFDGSALSSPNLVSTNSAGDEGGEIRLALAQTNTTLNTSVTIDVYQNKLRIFETGGTARGAYIDLSAATAGVGSNLLGSSGATTLDGLSDVVLTNPAANQILKFDPNTSQWINSHPKQVYATTDNNNTNYQALFSLGGGLASDVLTSGSFTFNPSTGNFTATGTVYGANFSAASGSVVAQSGSFSSLGTTGLLSANSSAQDQAKLSIGTNTLSAVAWTTNGIGLRIQAGTYNDRTSTGTVATSAVHAVASPTMTSTNAITVTNAASLYIAGGPTASTNTTITNKWGLMIGADGLKISSGTINVGNSNGTSGQVLTSTGTGVQWAAAPSNNNIAILQLGTSDTFNLSTTGSTESFTILSTGGISNITVSTNSFTLPAGTYVFQMPTITSSGTTYADWKIQNTTDNTETARFTSNTISMSGITKAFYWSPTTVFTIAASKTFKFMTTSGSAVLVNGATVNGKLPIFIYKTA